MGAYEYQALNRRGREQRGVLQGDTARQVRQLLREQGLSPLKVEPVTESAAGGRGWFTGGRLAPAERALIIRQLGSLGEAGLPLEEALGTVAEQSEKTAVRRILIGLRSRVMEGHSLSTSMAAFPRAFPELYRATIAAGEQSGRLDPVLERLADYAERREALGRTTWLALLYPAILTVVALAMVTGLMAYVVPRVAVVFESFDTELPLLTRSLMAVSDLLGRYGGWGLVALLALVVALLFALRSEPVRRAWHGLLLRTPVVGRLARAAETARFVRTLSILVGSAVPLLEALSIAGRVAGNLVVRDAVREVTVRVREGSSLHRAMAQSRQFPPLVVRLIAGGEKSGDLDDVLAKAAEIEEREVETASSVFTAVLEPLLILLVGALVLVIVLAILLPIFQMNQLIR